MSAFWLQPLAWWGLLAVAVPILIHLLVRQQSTRLPFPSLKFLRSTRVAALRRRHFSDWPLLIVRVLIVAFAVAALAAPVFVSVDRQRSWSLRMARAIIRVSTIERRDAQIEQEIDRLVGAERASAFVSASFTPATVADGLRDAVEWLQRQPPASREVVVIGDLRAGSVSGRDVGLIPSTAGVRFLPVVPAARARDVQLSAIAESAEGTTFQDLHITLENERTVARYRTGGAVTPPIEVRAAPEDQARVDAALRAVLAEGVLLHRQDRRVAIEFEGTPSATGRSLVQPALQLWMRRALEELVDLRGGEHDGRLVIRPGIQGSDVRAPDVIARVTRVTQGEDLRILEPRVVPARTIAEWSRPSGPIPDDVRPGDEGDRRFFWAAALMLLGLEQWMRRSRAATGSRTVVTCEEEARVA